MCKSSHHTCVLSMSRQTSAVPTGHLHRGRESRRDRCFLPRRIAAADLREDEHFIIDAIVSPPCIILRRAYDSVAEAFD
jgi:hypothetical protein